jgi:hypothetical protein
MERCPTRLPTCSGSTSRPGPPPGASPAAPPPRPRSLEARPARAGPRLCSARRTNRRRRRSGASVPVAALATRAEPPSVRSRFCCSTARAALATGRASLRGRRVAFGSSDDAAAQGGGVEVAVAEAVGAACVVALVGLSSSIRAIAAGGGLGGVQGGGAGVSRAWLDACGVGLAGVASARSSGGGGGAEPGDFFEHLAHGCELVLAVALGPLLLERGDDLEAGPLGFAAAFC